MPKFKAMFTVTLRCKVPIEADNLDAAWEKAQEYEGSGDLLPNYVVDEDVELDDVGRVKVAAVEASS